jgi:Ca-activated chloride channel family protein
MSSTTTTDVKAPPALMAKLKDESVPMTVRAIEIDVEIAGLLARTTMTITFENPHDQDLEGELTFPLPDSATLSGFGLDVDGQLVDASLVEKHRARVVFEEEVRKGIDPGLLEQVSGNLFRTRIWPLPAQGTRSVKVKYVSPLTTQGSDAFYELPLQFEPPRRDVSQDQTRPFAAWAGLFDSPVEEQIPSPSQAFKLRVTVAKSATTPEVRDAEEWSETFGFEDRGNAWIAETARTQGLPAKVRIGLPGVPDAEVAVERHDDSHYFRIDMRVDEPDPSAAQIPERVALAWDATLSRGMVDKCKDFELIRSLTKQWGSLQVELFVLRDTVEEPRRFPIIAGDAESLLEFLANLPYDGGTRLGALRLDSRVCDACLVFSDGLSNLDARLPQTAEVPTYVVSGDAAANRPLLRYVADQSGGAWLDLTQMSVQDAVNQIVSEGLTFLGAEFVEDEVCDIVPTGRRRLEDGRISVGGRLVAEEADVTLRFGRGNRETTRRRFRLRRAEAGTTGLIGRLWGRQKVEELSVFPDMNGGEMLELGRRFHIVTPNASLLVLETLEQHLEHKIPPARSRQKLWKAYHEELEDRQEVTRKRHEEKLEQIAKWWQDRVDWWEREFDPSPPPLRETSEEMSEGAVGLGPVSASLSMRRAAPVAGDDTELFLECAASPPFEEARILIQEPQAAPEDAGTDEPTSTSASITVKPWDPETPYLGPLKEATEEDVYNVYLAQRAEYGRSPSYYLDCAEHLFRRGHRDLGVRVLSNLAELNLESPSLLRVLGYKLETEGELELAGEILEQVLAMRPDEPQSYRDLALLLERRGEYRRATTLLWDVVTGEWDARFPEVETIALMELNHVLEGARCQGDDNLAKELGIDERLVKMLDLDLRVVLGWDAELTDVDLWVVEPNAEKCDYSHNRTRMGGRMSCDFTEGYGPEEYTLRRGMTGTYGIQANYYGSAQQTLIGPATILATIFTNFGRPDEQRSTITVRVTEVKDVVEVGEAVLS